MDANKTFRVCQQLFPNFTIYNKTSNKEIPVDTFKNHTYKSAYKCPL